jgi:hypothetical protein
MEKKQINEGEEYPFMSSSYPILNFIVIVIFGTFFLFVLMYQAFDFSGLVLFIITVFILLFFAILFSFLILYKIKIYSEEVEVKYLVNFNSKIKYIAYTNIRVVKYVYINGRFAHPSMKIYYIENGSNKSIEYLGESSVSVYAKALKNFKDKGITVEINPPDVLSEYGL